MDGLPFARTTKNFQRYSRELDLRAADFRIYFGHYLFNATPL